VHVDPVMMNQYSLSLLPDDCSAMKYSYCLVAKQDFVSVLEILQDEVDARIALASLLLEEGKEDEAISLLCPPNDSGISNMFSFSMIEVLRLRF